MCNAYAYMFDAKFVGNFSNLSIESNLRLTCGIVYYLDIRPGDLAAPAGAYQFKDRLFGGETAG
jgi:hypothetical protein